jgi:asparagine synthase (glutamine-hydrolysing)
MCGLSGEIRFDGSLADTTAVARMVEALVPRGPDGEGHWSSGRVAFGHRRLSVIDLSASGSQPMVDSELGLEAVFNGCIYDYKELRAELEGHGYRFFSTSDTEVLLKGYHHWGVDFVDHLHGMFVVVIHERDTGRVVMARDRLGIKPLYLAELPGRLRFARRSRRCCARAASTPRSIRWPCTTTCPGTRSCRRRARSCRASASCRRPRIG